MVKLTQSRSMNNNYDIPEPDEQSEYIVLLNHKFSFQNDKKSYRAPRP